jgi:uncharacterized protein (TIGR03083 family)
VSVDRETLLGLAHAERQRLGRMIQFAEPATWEQPSACSGWWNRDVMAHLAAQDTAAAQLVSGSEAEELEGYRKDLGDEPFTVDGFNAWVVNRRSGMTTREGLTAWGQAAESFLAHAALLSPEDWETRRFPWLSGSIAARYLVQSRIVEWWVHGEDMRAGNGLGPMPQQWPVHLTADLGIRMLPWALGVAGHAFPGRSVQVDLEGTGYGSWHWGLAPDETPGEDKKADAYIQGRAVQFALVAARRLDAGETLDAGHLVLGGDTELAETVLRTIRCYP